MDRAQVVDKQIEALASHLTTRREAILSAWREAVEADPELPAASSLPVTQFYDHIPNLLDAFERTLRCWPSPERAASEKEREKDAGSHGLQRWQQGYGLREVTREWNHLQLHVMDELERYALAHPELEPSVMPMARRAWAQFCGQGVSESASRYLELEQTEAVGHVRDLKQAVAQAQELERRRAELLRQAAHDLRGNLGAVTNATSGLARDGIPDARRDQFLRLLQRGVASLQSMLNEVMDLARLQAGQEHREVKPFDAARLLEDLCETLQAMASERGLFLRVEGPATLPVEGDAVMTRRVAQNLLLNALKYTQQGGVTVRYGDSRSNDPERWMLCVHDTGPGYHAGPGAPLVAALKEATEASQAMDAKGTENADQPIDVAPSPVPPDNRPVVQERGEGIGHSIVKRLCELMDASIELESTAGEGTSVRVLLPRRYA